MSNENTEFSLNQKIVYPNQGVGEITEIFEKQFNGKNVLYYKIYIKVSDMYVMVPVENAKTLGIRPIVSAEKAQSVLDTMGTDFEPPTSDWKARYQMNLDLLKKGTIEDISAIVRCLYHRSKVKELPILERKLYDNVKKLLEDEIAEALGLNAKEVEALLHTKLEPLGFKAEKKLPQFDDEEDDEEDEFADLDEDDKDGDNDSDIDDDEDEDDDSDLEDDDDSND